MKNTATLKKISEHLHISISTVSRALKDHPDVADETKRRVRELSEMLDYEPNAFAINLRKKHSNIYAIIVPEISSFFYHSFMQAVEEDARAQGYSIMLLQSMDDPDIEKANLKLCRYNHVAGVFACITRHTIDFSPFQKLIDMEIPVIFFDKVPNQQGFNTVSIADVEAGKLAAQKLIRSKKGRIWAFMGNASLSITHRRQQGFRTELELSGIHSFDIAYLDSEEDAYQMVTKQSEGYLDDLAIFCMSDEMLCGVMRGLYKQKVRIPEDVAVIAMSDGFLPRLFNPSISYVETSGYKLGKLSFKSMANLRSGVYSANESMLACYYYEGESS